MTSLAVRSCVRCAERTTHRRLSPLSKQGNLLSPFSSKTGWRSQPFKRTQPVLPVADVTPVDPSDLLAMGNEAEETATAVAEDCVVLEQEPDNGDVLSLVDHNAPDTADQ